jgi:hypothetical protein
MAKHYEKVHKTADAARDHLKKIRKRGGITELSYEGPGKYKVVYYFPDIPKGIDEKFIRQVAKDQGITRYLSPEDIKRAHKHASNGAKEDYYYRLKEFFYA